jgi:hypothetical protein
MTAVAVLFSGDPETGECSMDVFRSDDRTKATWLDGREMDPYHRAQGLRESCEGDFPTRVWAIQVNEEARRLMRNARMRAMGFTGPGYEQYDD